MRGSSPELGPLGSRTLLSPGLPSSPGCATTTSRGHSSPGTLRSINDPPFVALEWTGERSLAALVSQGKVFLETDALALVGSLAGALSEAHRLGLVHGRLTPHHVRLDESTSTQDRVHRGRGSHG